MISAPVTATWAIYLNCRIYIHSLTHLSDLMEG